MKFKYLISDMDGVLIDTERLIYEMYRKSALSHGFDLPLSVFLETIGKDAKDTRIILESHIPIDYDLFLSTREDFLVKHLNEFSAPLKDNVYDSLGKLRSSGIKMALATSTFKARAEFRVSKTDVFSYFDAFAFGDEVENGKPSPDIFLLAAKRINANPSECVVLEDSPAGVMAAKNAGMHVIMIPDMKEPDEKTKSLVDFCAKDLTAATDYILS